MYTENNEEIEALINETNITDNTKQLIKLLKPIDEFLHAVIMISNPCYFSRRYKLTKEFIERLETEFTDHVKLYVVEVVYTSKGVILQGEDVHHGVQSFRITNPHNPRHLQLKCDYPIWHKENAINIGIAKLLPEGWKAMAWIDADITFESAHWAEDTLKLLNVPKPAFIQLFSHSIDMDKDETPMTIFQGFGYQYRLGQSHGKGGLRFWHPGYAWACNRQAYDLCLGGKGLYYHSILGSGDHNMCLSMIHKAHSSCNEKVHPLYKESVMNFYRQMHCVSSDVDTKNSAPFYLGYTPGVIRHFFHGTKQNRKYVDRWKILVEHQYNPSSHFTEDENGLLIPTKECPKKLLDDIYKYFQERLEDD